MKNAWEVKKSVEQNLNDMGVSYDVNKTFRIPTARESLKPVRLEDDTEMDCDASINISNKKHVVEQIEIDAKLPRVKKFRLPDNQVKWLTYLMDKYGEDFKVFKLNYIFINFVFST